MAIITFLKQTDILDLNSPSSTLNLTIGVQFNNPVCASKRQQEHIMITKWPP